MSPVIHGCTYQLQHGRVLYANTTPPLRPLLDWPLWESRCGKGATKGPESDVSTCDSHRTGRLRATAGIERHPSLLTLPDVHGGDPSDRRTCGGRAAGRQTTSDIGIDMVIGMVWTGPVAGNDSESGHGVIQWNGFESRDR